MNPRQVRRALIDHPARAFGFAVLVGLVVARPCEALANYVVGSWDLSRGGFDSIADSPLQATQRALITAYRSDATFSSTSILTPSYLSTVNGFILGGQFSSSTTVLPLSAAEQTALFNFVAGGGNLLIATYSGSFDGAAGDASRVSIYAPFGIQSEGDSFGPNALATDLAHPIVNGPFGTLTTFPLSGMAGLYTNLGPYAHTVYVDSQFHQPLLATIEGGVIGPGSGRVVVTGAANAFASSLLSGNVTAYLIPVPEPSAAVYASTLLAMLVGGRIASRKAASRKAYAAPR